MNRPALLIGTLLAGSIAWLALGAAPAQAADQSCIVRDVPPDIALTPATAEVTMDPAFNPDDPDAATAPLASIRYPDETALWASVGLDPAAAETAAARSDAKALPFGDHPRADRAVSDSIVRLYCGLFGRKPHPFELQYWANRYWNGLPLVTIADAFTHAGEFVARRGTPTDLGLVTILFDDVLGRSPTADDIDAFRERLASGELTRGELVVLFTDSPEYVYRTATAPPRKPPLPYPDGVGSGKRIIYTDSGQRIWLIAATGELVKTHLVSGRRGVPGVGRYRVFSKSRHAYAPYGGITMEYMVRFARGKWPYGFHSIPVYSDRRPLQTKDQLGTHRSGGCVRQDFDDAKFVFEWADIGTPVILIP